MAQYTASGQRFICENIIIRVTRMRPASLTPTDPVHGTPPLSEDLPLLDASGSYVIEAGIRVVDGASSAKREEAKTELLDFAEKVKGSINLVVPDRYVYRLRCLL